MGDIMVATEAAQFYVGSELVTITPGTKVRAGHPMLALHPEYFTPLTADYEWADEPAAAPRNPSRADQRGARTR